MEIEIIQKKSFFIQDDYKIYIDGTLIYTAKSVFFSFMPKIQIFDLNQKEIGIVEKEFNFPKTNFPRYNLTFGTYSTIRVLSDSHTLYKMHVSKGLIEVCEQKGRKLGVFFNALQAGLIEKEKKSVLGGNKYSLKINENEVDKELIIAFTLAYDNFNYNNKKTMFYYDFGNVAINPEREIDPDWKPKK